MHKHHPCICLPFLLFGISLPAQYVWSWHVLFPEQGSTGEDLLLNPDGEVTMCGTSCFTARFDALGNAIWQADTLLADPFGYCVKLLPTLDGGTFAAGDYEDHMGTDNLVGFHQDMAGNLLGTTIVNTPGTNTGDEFHDAAQDSEGNIYLTGDIRGNPVRS